MRRPSVIRLMSPIAGTARSSSGWLRPGGGRPFRHDLMLAAQHRHVGTDEERIMAIAPLPTIEELGDPDLPWPRSRPVLTLLPCGPDAQDAPEIVPVPLSAHSPAGWEPSTTGEVVAMSQKGVAEDLIINHVRSHGIAAPLQSSDLIYLQQQGVSPRVVATMQTPVAPAGAPVMVPVAPQPVFVAGPGYCPPPYPYAYRAYHPAAGSPANKRAPATFAAPSEEPAPIGLRR